ncbi:MAG: Fic family protein, partial [Nitriliruptoraceae bacterium]
RTARTRAIVDSLALDGASVTDDEVLSVVDDVLAPRAATAKELEVIVPVAARASWANALKIDPPTAARDVTGEPQPTGAAGGADPRLRVLEILGVAHALACQEAGVALRTNLLDALAALHRSLTTGLVAPERIGAFRASEQAVHDGASGRILYFVSLPDEVPGALTNMECRLADATLHPVVVAGLAHLDVLRIHPFDAANGRLARAVSSWLLRTSDTDPHGVVSVEAALASEPLAYHEQVAASLRRSDLAAWLCWWAESVESALIDSLSPTTWQDTTGVEANRAHSDRPSDLAEWLLSRDDEPAATLTITDVRNDLGIDLDAARDLLTVGLRTGVVRRVRGSMGLRYLAGG